jgi:hypothetical protein
LHWPTSSLAEFRPIQNSGLDLETANLFCDRGGHQVLGYVSFENRH